MGTPMVRLGLNLVLGLELVLGFMGSQYDRRPKFDIGVSWDTSHQILWWACLMSHVSRTKLTFDYEEYYSAWYLDSGVERRPIFLLEAGPNVQHVHLTPWHHYPHQGAVVCPSTLCTLINFRGYNLRMTNVVRLCNVPSWTYRGVQRNNLEHSWHIWL